MNLNLLLGLLIAATVAATYVFWIRPELKARPSLGFFFSQEQSFFTALKLKFDGLKQKLVTAIVGVSAFVVSAYDFIAPYVAQSGIDVTTLSDKVPPQAWPVIGFALVLLLQYLRKLGDKSLLAKVQPPQIVTLDTPALPTPPTIAAAAPTK